MEINEELRLLIQQIVHESIMQLASDGVIPSVGPNINDNDVKLLEYYDKWIEGFGKQVEAEQKAESTLRKHKTVYAHLEGFLGEHYGKEDLSFTEIDKDFQVNFNLYLTKKGLSLNSRCVYMGPVQMLFRLALNDGLIAMNHNKNFHLSMEDKSRGFLTEKEIEKIKAYPCNEGSQQAIVRDLFLFCCYTGLSYIDLVRLQNDNIISNPNDSHLWILTNRKKTGVEVSVRLLPEAMSILQNRRQHSIYNNVYAVPSHKTCNRIIKKISEECGIKKKVTWHIARHTMATTICLSHGMPIETVAKVLGHKKLRSTQIYAKITQEVLSKEMDKIEISLRK